MEQIRVGPDFHLQHVWMSTHSFGNLMKRSRSGLKNLNFYGGFQRLYARSGKAVAILFFLET